MSWGDHDQDLIRAKLSGGSKETPRRLTKTIEFDHSLFRADIIQKRLIERNISFREASQEIGISEVLLNRLENSKIPDVDVLCKVCYWMGKVPTKYFVTK